MKYNRLLHLTPSLADRSFAQTLAATTPPVYMCRRCVAVHVPEKDIACNRCIAVEANRLAVDARWHDLRRKVIITLAIVGFAALAFIAAIALGRL